MRSKKGQSMVEYAIGIGCVTAVCMIALGGVGHEAADILKTVNQTINDADDQVSDPGSIFGQSGWTTKTPWNPQ